MARAYVLIKVAIGKVPSVVEALRRVPGVTADAITGPYDAIAVVEGETTDDIGMTVMRRIHRTAGVNQTKTCFVVE